MALHSAGSAIDSTALLAHIDWTRPWLAPLAHLRTPLETGIDVRAQLNGLAKAHQLCTGFGQPLVFVAPDDAGDMPYELHIAQTGRVPTRNNLHDVFNAAIWLTMPRFKAAMNARQAHCILSAVEHGRALEEGRHRPRGAQRDAATLLDESGLILAVDAADESLDVRACLRAHDWQTIFNARRSQWHTRWVPWLVGHAVLEKLIQPYAAITVRVQVVRVAQDHLHNPRAVDESVASDLANAPHWVPVQLPPMPVLGIPGWWSDNEQPDFYNDVQVFRPARTSEQS